MQRLLTAAYFKTFIFCSYIQSHTCVMNLSSRKDYDKSNVLTLRLSLGYFGHQHLFLTHNYRILWEKWVCWMYPVMVNHLP